MASRPNILFIMTDQMRWDAMGCSGGWVRTPALDRIAAEGVRFPDCFTTTPVCIPARVTMATGLYCHNTSVWTNGPYTLSPDSATWMQAVRDAGYRTSLFGKTHLHPHAGDLRDREHLMRAYGIDDVDEIGGPRASSRVLSHMTERWQTLGLWTAYRRDFADRFATCPHVVRSSTLPLAEYADVYVGRQAARYLSRYERSEPWFCWVSFGGPHEPWDAPEPYASMYDPATMPAPVPVPEWSTERPIGQLDRRLQQRPQLCPEEVAAMRANYAGNVTLIDAQIGDILDVIEQRGEMGNTVIVFTSDHGELNGDAGLIYKSTFLDGCLRVPLLVRTPQTVAAGGGVHHGPVEWADVGPTLVDVAGGRIDWPQFARSLVPVLRKPGREHRSDALAEIANEVALVTRAWKIALNRNGEPYLLFDRCADPAERHNLAGSPAWAHIEERLCRRILERLVQAQANRF